MLFHFKKHALFFGLLSLLISIQSFAQKSIIIGQVFNDREQVLPGANVISPTLQIGATTDDEGKFSLQVEAQSLSLTVTYIGYNSRSIRISKEELLQNGQLELRIELSPTTQEIGTASVIGERRIAVVEEPRESVLDFEFLGEDLLVLISNKKGYRIERFNEELQSIGAMNLDTKPEGIYKDCFGGVHLRYRYHVDELKFLGKSISILASYDIQEFRRILSPCIASTSSDLYFRSTEMSNQRINYFAKNKQSKKSRILHVIEEKERMELIEGNQKYIVAMKERLATENFATPSDRLAVEREIMQSEWFDELILSKIAYHPLFQHSDSLYVFDHYKSSLFVYDNAGTLNRLIPIDYHLNKDWAKRILLDEVTGKFYIDIAGQGISMLYDLNINNGNYHASLKIEDHTFPEKMKVRKNRVWYIHQDLDQDTPALYVMDLPLYE